MLFTRDLAKQANMTLGAFLQSYIEWACSKNHAIQYYNEESLHKDMINYVKELKK